MKIDYTLTLADYKAALRLHWRQKITSRIVHLFWLMFLPILAVLAWASFFFNLNSQPISFPGSLSLPLIMSFWCAAAALLNYFNVRKQFNNIFPPARTDHNVSINIDEDHIVSAIPGSSEGKFFWNAIVNFAQDENITLFYVAEKKFLFVPTTAFSPAERTELNEIVARKVVRKQP